MDRIQKEVILIRSLDPKSLAYLSVFFKINDKKTFTLSKSISSHKELQKKDIKGFHTADRILIAQKIHYLADNFKALRQAKKIRELKGTKFNGQYRYTIARKIRAIFRIEDSALVINIHNKNMVLGSLFPKQLDCRGNAPYVLTTKQVNFN